MHTCAPEHTNIHEHTRESTESLIVMVHTCNLSTLGIIFAHPLSTVARQCAVNFKKQCGQMPRKHYRGPVCGVTRLTVLWKIIAWEFSIAKEHWNVLT